MTRFQLIVIISALVYFSNLGGTSVYILDEAKNAGCAMEMRQHDSWIIPTFNGKLRTDKPPLHYYFMMAAYSVFGVTPFAARFFSAIAGILLSVLVYRNTKAIINEQTAFYTILAMLSSIQLTVQFHLAVPDPYLILFVAWSLFSFYNGINQDPKHIKWIYVACGLAFLTKGLIAIVMPTLIIGIYLIMTGQLNWSTIRKLNLPMGILVFCIIALPWYALVGYLTDGAWLRGFFIQHNLERYTSTMEGHKAFPLAPFAILITALLPFSVFIIQAISKAWTQRVKHPLLLLGMITVLVFGLFFSFSKTLLPSYPAPAIPFLAMIVGYYISQLEVNGLTISLGNRISLILNFVVSIGLCIAAYIALQMEKEMSDLIDIAWIFAIVPVGSAVGAYYYARKRWDMFAYSWSGSWIILGLLFFYFANPRIDSKNPVSTSIIKIHRDYPDRRVIGFHIFNPAYVFALQSDITVVDTLEDLRKISSTGEKIIVLTRSKFEDEFGEIQTLKEVYQGKDLFERNVTVVLAN